MRKNSPQNELLPAAESGGQEILLGGVALVLGPSRQEDQPESKPLELLIEFQARRYGWGCRRIHPFVEWGLVEQLRPAQTKTGRTASWFLYQWTGGAQQFWIGVPDTPHLALNERRAWPILQELVPTTHLLRMVGTRKEWVTLFVAASDYAPIEIEHGYPGDFLHLRFDPCSQKIRGGEGRSSYSVSFIFLTYENQSTDSSSLIFFCQNKASFGLLLSFL